MKEKGQMIQIGRHYEHNLLSLLTPFQSLSSDEKVFIPFLLVCKKELCHFAFDARRQEFFKISCLSNMSKVLEEKADDR